MTLGTCSFVNRKLLIAMSLILLCASAWAGQWTALGPDGGDVRSLTYDPQNPDHIFLGTSTGTIFHSTNGGQDWSRVAHLGSGDDYVIDHIALDPQNSEKMYAAVWSVENQQAGDLFHSHNGGKTWETVPAMHGKSIRAMSIAASDSKVLTVGALDGVFRSKDAGKNWEKISSSNSEIKNIESIAIDPKDPSVVYAGHLAPGVEDRGRRRQLAAHQQRHDRRFRCVLHHRGFVELFGRICQRLLGHLQEPERRRTVLEDSRHPVFGAPHARAEAGPQQSRKWFTRERPRVCGRPPTAGKTWKRVTNPEVVVNDVMVDPRNSQRVLLATDRAGVLASDDGAESFTASNHGYTHRYVTTILADKNDPETIYVGVVNDREQGGVFVSHDGGQHWTQKSAGLDGRDVFVLKQAGDGDIIAGTNRGMFELRRNASTWSPINNIMEEKGSKKTKTTVRSVLTAKVSDIEITSKRWLAATAAGLYTSSNDGQSWNGGPVMGKKDFVSVQADGELIALATRSSVLTSTNGGATWQESNTLAPFVSSIRSLTITPDKQIMIASREGAFRSPNAGGGWEHMQNGLPDKNISSITYDQSSQRLLATSTETGVVFESQDNGQSWQRGPDTGYPLRRISVVHGHFVAATPFDGVVVQPDGDRSASAGVGSSTN